MHELAARRRVRLALACLLVAVSFARAEAVEREVGARKAIESIAAAKLRTHVDELASDAYEGREAGSRGGLRAAEYVAGKLRHLQLASGTSDDTYYQRFVPNCRNVLAMAAGRDAALRQQVVILGAHYDHVGRGTSKTSRGGIGQIHNGADDNASGVAALLEIAEALTLLPEAPRRSILLIAFDGEEQGLWGSRHWMAYPTVKIEDVVAMLNVDMIGRLRDERVTVVGTRSAFGWRRRLSAQNERFALRLVFDWDMSDDADQYPFFAGRVPTLLFNTGLHDEYHTPRDKASLINADGMERVTRLIFSLVCRLAEEEVRPVYRPAATRESEATHKSLDARMPATPERLGVMWDDRFAGPEGVRLARVNYASPAARAGLRTGDIILEFTGRKLASGEELRDAVRVAESPAKALIRRGLGKPFEVDVALAGEPLRLGVKWSFDDAEPNAVLLTYVADGSPAAAAGLERGDRLYQVNGRDVTRDNIGELLRDGGEDLTLAVERDGRIRRVVVELAAKHRRAA